MRMIAILFLSTMLLFSPIYSHAIIDNTHTPLNDNPGIDNGRYTAAASFDFISGIDQLTKSHSKEIYTYISLLQLDKAASELSISALELLGYFYYNGIYTKVDYPKAKEYFEQGAKQSSAYSEYMLSLMYLEGLGVQPDYKKSLALAVSSLNHGEAKAAGIIGLIYRDGLGVPKDIETGFLGLKAAAFNGSYADQIELCSTFLTERKFSDAFYCLQLLSEKGNSWAQDLVAFFYSIKDSDDYDIIEAYKWSRLAATSHVTTSIDRMASIEKSMTADELATASRLAEEWKPNPDLKFDENAFKEVYFKNLQRKAESGNPSAQFMVGLEYFTINEHDKSIYWVDLARKNGEPDAEVWLGYIFVTHLPKNEDYISRGMTILTNAAQNENPVAQYLIGSLYMEDLYIKKDVSKAKYWLTKSAAHGNSDSKRLLETIEN